MPWHRPLRLGSFSTKISFESLEQRDLLTVSSFALEDVNTTSQTHGEVVSPGDFSGSVSGWYFGSAT